ncbi:MAG: nuclear transport factor 2 family protein [Dehalococcoidia bacterium]|nr:nuclear transport factor 2 family protein [Dehalococcoidia bacterium]
MKLAEQFIAALTQLETAGNSQPMVALFADNCEIGNVVAPDPVAGIPRAREFWRHYRDTFVEVRSRFRNQIVSDNRIALEWITEGKSKQGNQVTYEGVSILETDGKHITRFYAYFDAGKLGQQMSGETDVKAIEKVR